MKPVVRCLLAGSMLALVGCSSASASASHPITAEYLAVLDGSVSLLQITDTHGALDGTVQSATKSGQAPSETVSNDTEPLAGAITGSTVRLSVARSPEIFGTLSKGALTLNVPQDDGTLEGIVYNKAGNPQFNTALSQLQADVSNDNQTATNEANQAAAAAAAEAAQRRAEGTVTSAANSVAADVTSVASDVSSLGPDVQSNANDVASTGSDLTTAKTDDQTVVTEQAASGANDGQTCDDAAQVSDDAAQVSDDAAQVSDDIDTLQTDMTTLLSDMSTLHADWVSFQSAEAVPPGYSLSGSPTEADVNQAGNHGKAAIIAATSATNIDIDETNGQVAAAYAAANQANNVASCGSPASASTPLAHI